LAGPQVREHQLSEPERGQHIDGVHDLEDVKRVVGEWRLRAGAEEAGVVDEHVQPSELVDNVAELGSVCGVGDAACQRDDVRRPGGPEFGRDSRQLGPASGVDHQGVTATGEGERRGAP
jgi:hypothetical protein